MDPTVPIELKLHLTADGLRQIELTPLFELQFQITVKPSTPPTTEMIYQTVKVLVPHMIHEDGPQIQKLKEKVKELEAELCNYNELLEYLK